MRAVNRLASVLLALALLGGGLLLTAETARAALHRPPLLVPRQRWYTALTGARLDSGAVRAVAGAVAVVGLLILLAQLRRWAPDRLAVALGDGWYVRRRGAERRLADAAAAVVGVRRARVRVRRGGTWRPRVRAAGDPATAPAVRDTVERELDALAAPQVAHRDVDVRVEETR
jgi:hypothetical protein